MQFLTTVAEKILAKIRCILTAAMDIGLVVIVFNADIGLLELDHLAVKVR